METKILNWKNEMVITAKIENEAKERKIMYNKNKLRGEKIYIEHNLSWDERKKQETIGNELETKR